MYKIQCLLYGSFAEVVVLSNHLSVCSVSVHLLSVKSFNLTKVGMCDFQNMTLVRLSVWFWKNGVLVRFFKNHSFQFGIRFSQSDV